jgi:hypothetical protein
MHLLQRFSGILGALSIGMVMNSGMAWSVVDSEAISRVRIREIKEVSQILPSTWNELKPIASIDQRASEGTFPAFDDLISGANSAQVLLDSIVNLGKMIWALIEANKPVINISTHRAHALPEGLISWEQLSEWQVPVSKNFQATYQNFFGTTVVDFTYRLIYTYGGSFKGKGHYLTNILVIPSDLKVSAGYTFNAEVNFPGPVNLGTSENPIAGTEILVKWKVDHWWKHSEGSHSFFIRGDGAFEDLSGKNMRVLLDDQNVSEFYPDLDEGFID